MASRVDQLAAARAAGLRGEDPGPGWLGDDPAYLEAYEQGLGEYQAGLEGRPRRGAQPRAGGRPGASGRGKPRKSASGDPEPVPAPSGGSVPPPSARVVSMPTDTAHDLAGVLVGTVAVAFLINVLHGTWRQWLKAKFLNEVPAKPAPKGATH